MPEESDTFAIETPASSASCAASWSALMASLCSTSAFARRSPIFSTSFSTFASVRGTRTLDTSRLDSGSVAAATR